MQRGRKQIACQIPTLTPSFLAAVEGFEIQKFRRGSVLGEVNVRIKMLLLYAKMRSQTIKVSAGRFDTQTGSTGQLHPSKSMFANGSLEPGVESEVVVSNG